MINTTIILIINLNQLTSFTIKTQLGARPRSFSEPEVGSGKALTGKLVHKLNDFPLFSMYGLTYLYKTGRVSVGSKVRTILRRPFSVLILILTIYSASAGTCVCGVIGSPALSLLTSIC